MGTQFGFPEIGSVKTKSRWGGAAGGLDSIGFETEAGLGALVVI